jgi:hypothetical protein
MLAATRGTSMIQMTKIPGVMDKHRAVPGMAFYEGSGPVGKRCSDCEFMLDANRTKRCKMYTELTGKEGPVIRGYYNACKYFRAFKKNSQVQSRK